MAKDRGFLVVTRREYERVIITTPKGEVVEIVVKRIKGAQVRLGIGAPKSFDVMRADARTKEDFANLYQEKEDGENQMFT